MIHSCNIFGAQSFRWPCIIHSIAFLQATDASWVCRALLVDFNCHQASSSQKTQPILLSFIMSRLSNVLESLVRECDFLSGSCLRVRLLLRIPDTLHPSRSNHMIMTKFTKISGTLATILMLLTNVTVFAWMLALSAGWPNAGSCAEFPKPIRARKRSSDNMQMAFKVRTLARRAG